MTSEGMIENWTNFVDGKPIQKKLSDAMLANRVSISKRGTAASGTDPQILHVI